MEQQNNIKFKVLKINETKLEVLEKILNNGWKIKCITPIAGVSAPISVNSLKPYAIYILFKEE